MFYFFLLERTVVTSSLGAWSFFYYLLTQFICLFVICLYASVFLCIMTHAAAIKHFFQQMSPSLRLCSVSEHLCVHTRLRDGASLVSPISPGQCVCVCVGAGVGARAVIKIRADS